MPGGGLVDMPVLRQVLPIPRRVHNTPATYDAKDPDTAFPADRAVAAAGGAPRTC